MDDAELKDFDQHFDACLAPDSFRELCARFYKHGRDHERLVNLRRMVGAFKAGGFAMQASQQIPIEIVTVVQSLIVLFIAAPPLVRTIFFLPSPERDARRREKAREKELKRKVDADPSTDAQGIDSKGVSA